MMRRLFAGWLLLLVLAVPALAQQPAPGAIPLPDISFQKFVLDNGLTVIIHEDHKAPIVAVNLWYHVGSKNEKPGRTGFAHLFEHLMFNGSENFDDDYFRVLERVGATELNGTTWFDRTNYFQNVPTNALDLALWMESDRMGHLLGAITQEKLDEQRGVVQNEKRQGENEPYGRVDEMIQAAIYPVGHPYSWETIGSMEDLSAAALEDVKEWFRTYYGPNNAVLVLAGDVDASAALEKVRWYFGDIPPGPPIAKQEVWVAKRTGEHRQTMQDRVPQARIYKVWNTPPWGTREAALLNLVSSVLASGKTSRLYHRLVYTDQVATDVSAPVLTFEIGGQFRLVATARPGADLAQVERALDEELARLLKDGPTEAEVVRAKTQYLAGFLRSVEGVGGFGGKSSILAESEVYGGNPAAYKQTLQWIQQATPAELQRVAQAWLADGAYVLEVHPYPELKAAAQGADRTEMPSVGPAPVAQFPALQRATLANGLQVILAERHAAPVVEMSLLVDAGYAADNADKPGTASLALNMLDEGTTTRSALEISEALAGLGASLGTGSNLDLSVVSASALKANLAPTLDLFADVVLNPAFPQADLDRLKQQQLAQIQREKVSPLPMALRVFPKLLYGPNHAYGLPFTGTGTEAAVAAMTRDDLVAFHRTWFKPNNATLVVVGDVTMSELKPLLEQRFRAWERGTVPTKNIATVRLPEKPVVYLLDRPGAQQSIIFAGHVAPPKDNPNELAIEAMNTALGGAFISRINMNLREDKGWAYGAFSVLVGARGQRPFLAYAPVQTDKTKESMEEILKELRAVRAERPVTADEVAMAQSNLTLTLPGQWETSGAVLGSISELVRYGLDDTYWNTYPAQVQALSVDAVARVAREVVHPERLTWIVVGDRSKIEAGIRALNLGEVRYIDADGNPVQGGTE